jgi:hypothetical protein
MQWLGTSKYTIFLILLKFQDLWNLIKYSCKTTYENVYFNVSYDFSKFDGSKKKSRCDVSNGTTQRCFYLDICY